jgi:hypothetical protein
MNFTNFDRLPAEWSMTCLGLLSGEFARNGDCASVQRLDRLKSLSAKVPSRETSIAITKCDEALMWLEKRTADRKKRAVEGTNAA